MSRALAFWNDETIALIRGKFVAVAVPTWVARAEGPEGEFLRGAGIHQKWVTSSGYMHCVSASGTLLGGRPSEEVLDAFEELPLAERQPGAVPVPALNASEGVIPSPPEGGLVLKVHARFLSGDYDGEIRSARVEDFPLMADDADVRRTWRLFLEPNTESMWMTREEWEPLVSDDPRKGERLPVDGAIAMRMARFHLNPKRSTTSEGGIVDRKRVKTARLELVVEGVDAGMISLRLEGEVHWGSDFTDAFAISPNGPLPLGYAAALDGRLSYDRRRRRIERFDLVALGHVWGRWGDANGRSMYVERAGKTPFGFAFELAKGESPTERIPPGGNGRYVTDNTGYFAPGE